MNTDSYNVLNTDTDDSQVTEIIYAKTTVPTSIWRWVSRIYKQRRLHIHGC